MWPFKPNLSVEKLRGYRKIVINGMAFTIRKLNPLIDFRSDQIPQIFTDYESARARIPDTPQTAKKAQEDMYAVIHAGVVSPDLVPEGKKDGLNPSDLFRDPTMGLKLYYEIIYHSLNHFKGFKRLFFWIGIKLSLLMLYANGTVNGLAVYSLKKEKPA